MTDKEQNTIHVDSAEIRKGLPAYDLSIRCPDHPQAEPDGGYGLAGGGFGTYSICPICCRILSKSQDSQYDEE